MQVFLFVEVKSMRRYIYIGIGGFMGAISRYALKNLHIFPFSNQFYLNTFIINVLGCFILTFFFRLALDFWAIDTDLRLGISTGFVGAFTTFSTLCRETVGLLLAGDVLLSFMNLMLSVMIGLAAIYIGDLSAKTFIRVKVLFEDALKV
jgi:CrcB protein